MLQPKRFTPHFLLILGLVLTVLVYRPGLEGSFLLDDFHTITSNTHIAINDLNPATLARASFSATKETPGRPLSMLSFAANYYASGLQAYDFKLTNLVIHLCNGMGIYMLCVLLLNTYRNRWNTNLSSIQMLWISVAVSCTWLLHPLNLTSVLYVVQRMTSLSAFFSIWGLLLFTWGRTRLNEGKSGIGLILGSLIVFTSLSTLSKENGILLPFLFFVIEFSLFQFQAPSLFARRFLIGFYVLTVTLPIMAIAGYTIWHPSWMADRYQTRNFNLSERLMTEGRVLWFYIKQILLPSTTQMSLFHDDIAISRSLLNPFSTLTSLVGLAGLGAIAIYLRKKTPFITFGVLFFLTGHALESTVLPLEIAYEHRNYLPMLGLLLAGSFYLLHPLQHTKSLSLRRGAMALLIALFAFGTYSRSSTWADPFSMAKAEVEHHPASIRANNDMANIYSALARNSLPREKEIYYGLARSHYENLARIDDNDTQGLIGLIMLNAFTGKSAEPVWLTQLSNRMQHAPVLPINLGKKLEGLVICQLDHLCNFPPKELEALIYAPLRNPSITGVRRALIYSSLSFYLTNIKQDKAGALAAARQAVAIAPQEIAFRFSLIRLLINSNSFQEAQSQLVIASSLDKWHIHQEKIQEYNKLLLNKEK